MDLSILISKAKSSSFSLWWLNVVLQRGIPFNSPHRLKVLKILDDSIEVEIPYIRKNLNHIKGLHACCMATAAEFSSGMLLVSKLDSTKFRLIMESFEMKYHYQGKKAAHAVCTISQEWLNKNVLELLKNSESVMVKCETKVHDIDGNHLCTGFTNWQIKNWNKVKTKPA